jgi:hypothetical protein
VSIADDVTVAIIVADYAAADASSKVNILGGGWQVTGLTATGLTPGQALAVLVDVPAKYRGEQFALGVTLINEANEPVMLPSVAGPTGEPQAVRMQQLMTVDPPIVPGLHLPPNVPSRVQMIIHLPNGLPLPPNQLYRWEVEVDGNKKPHWQASFYVAGPPPGPVLG